MLEPVIADLKGELAKVKWALVGIVGLGLMFWVGRCEGGKDAVVREHVVTLSHEVKVLVPVYLRDTVIAHDTKVRYDSLRVSDTVVRNDTVFVPRVIADGTINACTQALHDCERLRVVNDSLVHFLGKQKAGFKDRVGVFVGPVAVYSAGTIHAGVGVGVGIKVWP